MRPRSIVDAQSGATRAVDVLSKNNTGSGQVFDPNPVVALRNESLTDEKNRNQQVLMPAYKVLPLLYLGSGPTLVGKYAQVVAARGPLASSDTHRYIYTRADYRFEQVNAYYGVTNAQAYIQSLGFDGVNDESQKLSIDTFVGDNSFYSPRLDLITYGTGGVDDAEDLEVVWHEYGHAIQDAQVPGYGSSEQAGATGEGFGDYWAVTMSQPTSRLRPAVRRRLGLDVLHVRPACTACAVPTPARPPTTSSARSTPTVRSGRTRCGTSTRRSAATSANTVILEAQFSYTPDNSFAQAATQTVIAARALYGDAAAAKVQAAFVARKILS